MLIEEKQMELSRQEDVLRIDHKGNTTKIEAKIISYAIEHSYLPLWEIKYTFHQKERFPN